MSAGFKTVVAFVATAFVLAAPSPSRAAFPEKPVTLVIGSAVGGPADVFARAIAAQLTDDWKQQVIVDARPGASETIAAQIVSRAAPDGHTLLFSSETPLLLAQYVIKNMTYNPDKDFVPVSHVVSGPLVLVVSPTLPVKSIDEFVALAKTRASNPLTYGSAGAGNVLHLPMVELERTNGLQLLHVPYKGAAPALVDLMAGRIDALWIGVSGAVPYVRDSRVKALVVGGTQRLKILPNVPVFSETSIAPIRADYLYSLVAPANTPLAVRETIAAAMKKVLADPKFRDTQIDAYGYVPVASTPAEFEQFLAKDRPVQATRIKAAGVKPE